MKKQYLIRFGSNSKAVIMDLDNNSYKVAVQSGYHIIPLNISGGNNHVRKWYLLKLANTMEYVKCNNTYKVITYITKYNNLLYLETL